MRIILTMTLAIVGAAAAHGQYPGGYGGYPGGYGGYGGGYSGGYGGYGGLYGGGLSPFLNLRGRGGANVNPAVNYYNFVRPYTGGTFGNAYMPFGGGMGGPRSTFFGPVAPVYTDEEPGRQKVDEPDEKGIQRVDMPPAGHAAGFNNTMGYFGSPGAASGASLGRPSPVRRR